MSQTVPLSRFLCKKTQYTLFDLVPNNSKSYAKTEYLFVHFPSFIDMPYYCTVVGEHNLHQHLYNLFSTRIVTRSFAKCAHCIIPAIYHYVYSTPLYQAIKTLFHQTSIIK